MTAEYPNLQLLDYLFRTSMKQRLGDEYKYKPVNAHVFPQVWPNTAGGFSAPGIISGQAFTKEYTTVMFCEDFNMAFVAFGNEPAYMIRFPNETFMKDFEAKNMKSQYQSEKFYKEEEKQ